MSGDSRWKCKKGHVLGHVKTVRAFGQDVTRLYLYRRAVVEGEGEVEVMAVVEGAVMDVRCDVCGAIRTWVPSPEIVRVMVARLKGVSHG